MAGGRPREPISILEAKGKKHLTKSEIEERKNSEVDAPADDIRAPNYLKKKQKDEFFLLANQLVALKIFSNLDVDALARYIDSRDEYVRVMKELRSQKPVEERGLLDAEGKPLLDKKGNQKKVKVINETYRELQKSLKDWFSQCKMASSDLGLTITSRCKLVIPTPEKPKDSKYTKYNKRANG